MGRKTTLEQAGCVTAVAVATLSITVLAAPAGPLVAQEVIELPTEDRLLDPDFEEIYRLGSLDGGGWDTFSRIAGLGFDGARNLYILDTQAMRISVVDPEGKLVRQFIGEGEGPGEFGNQYAVALRFAVLRDGQRGLPSTTRGASDSPSSVQTASLNARSLWAATARGVRSFGGAFRPSREWSGCSPRPWSSTWGDPIRGRDLSSGTS